MAPMSGPDGSGPTRALGHPPSLRRDRVMKVLVVGAAGHVGTIVRPALEREHDCRFFDRRALPDTNGRCIVGDVNDEGLVRQAVQETDAVVYLAMGVKPDAKKGAPTSEPPSR